MGKVKVFIMCDADGYVQDRSVMSVGRLFTRERFLDEFLRLPAIVATEISDPEIHVLQMICPSVAVVTDRWVVSKLLEYLYREGGKEFSTVIIANRDSYQNLLNLDYNIELFVVSPAISNADFEYRGWKKDGAIANALTWDDTSEYVVNKFVREGDIELSEDTLDDEISRIEQEINDDKGDFSESEESDMNLLTRQILAGWRQCNGMEYNSIDADDDNDDEDDDDDGLIRLDMNPEFGYSLPSTSEVGELKSTIDFIGKHQAEMARQISDVLSSMKVMSNTLLSAADRINDVSFKNNLTNGLLVRTRKQNGTILYKMHNQLRALRSTDNTILSYVTELDSEVQVQYKTLMRKNRSLRTRVILSSIISCVAIAMHFI